jgi:hypothetical protein
MGDTTSTNTNANSGGGGNNNQGGGAAGMSTNEMNTALSEETITNNQTTAGTGIVQYNLGIKPYIANPNENATGGNVTGYYSTTGNQMYGGAASTATNEYLESIGEATKGSQNPDGSYNYLLTAKGWEMKYGSYTPGQTQEGGAMGDGSSGIMGGIPISEEMFDSQKKLQMITTGAMALAGVPVMGAAFAEYNANKYSDYVNTFNNTLQSSTSMASSGKSDSGSTNATSTSMATGTTTINDTGVDGGPSEAARLKKLALTKKTAALDAKRKLFNTTNQTITGAMV